MRAYSSQTNQDDFLLRSANLHTAETRESPHCRESLSNISRVHAPNPMFPDALLAHWARAPFGSRSARLFSVRLLCYAPTKSLTMVPSLWRATPDKTRPQTRLQTRLQTQLQTREGPGCSPPRWLRYFPYIVRGEGSRHKSFENVSKIHLLDPVKRCPTSRSL